MKRFSVSTSTARFKAVVLRPSAIVYTQGRRYTFRAVSDPSVSDIPVYREPSA